MSLATLTALKAEVIQAQPSERENSENILKPFAGAYNEISQIHTSYEERIIQSNDPAQADALQQEANQKMQQAVANHGLTVEDYNALYKSIKNDPDLKKEFLMVLNQIR